jgi:transposase
MLLALLVYKLRDGMFSSRQIERASYETPAVPVSARTRTPITTRALHRFCRSTRPRC